MPLPSPTWSGLLRERATEQAPGSVTSSHSPIASAHTYLLVDLGPTFYFSYYHSHDGAPVGRSEGKELLVGGDVTIP